MNEIINQINDSISIKSDLLNNSDILRQINDSAELISSVYREGFKTLIAGNGGSAADAQHMAGELVSRFYFDRPGLSSIALTTDTSVITAIGNDYGFEKVFARQIESIGISGDVFIGISTSGNSRNIIEAIKKCREKNIKVIGLTGKNGGEIAKLCDICIQVPSDKTPRIQEVHLLIEHIICGIIEENIFSDYKP